MASKYVNKFQIPGSFPELLNDFALKVLEDQPKNIYDFGAQYFAAMEEVNKYWLDLNVQILSACEFKWCNWMFDYREWNSIIRRYKREDNLRQNNTRDRLRMMWDNHQLLKRNPLMSQWFRMTINNNNRMYKSSSKSNLKSNNQQKDNKKNLHSLLPTNKLTLLPQV